MATKEERFARFRSQTQQHLDALQAQRIKAALSHFLDTRVNEPFNFNP